MDAKEYGKFLGEDYYIGKEGVGSFVGAERDGKFVGVDYYMICGCREREGKFFHVDYYMS